MHFSCQFISRKTNCRNHCCESDVLSLCLSLLVLLRGSLIALCKGLGAAGAVEQMCQRVFHTPGTDDNKTLLGKIKKFVTPTIPDLLSLPSWDTQQLPVFMEWAKGFGHISRDQGCPCQSERTLSSKAVGKCNICPCPLVQEVMGSQKSHSGKSARFLLGHTIHNSFLGYNFCMYPVILF